MLILDEPANGLDPAGIRWMRDLLRDFADHGGTVLLSSHLLHEIEVIADDIVMIRSGRHRVPRLQGRALRAAGTAVRARDMNALEQALRESGLATTRSHDGALRADAEPDRRRAGRPIESGLALTELRTADGGLEDLFLQLTADTPREGKAA